MPAEALRSAAAAAPSPPAGATRWASGERRDEEGGGGRERRPRGEVAGKERKHVRRPGERRGRAQGRRPRQARQARREVKQRGRHSEKHARSEPRRAGQLEEREDGGVAGEVLGGKPGDDEHVRRLEELRQRRRRVAEMAGRERLRLEEVDEFVFRTRAGAPLAAGKRHHAERSAQNDEEGRGQGVEAIGPRGATYIGLQSSNSPSPAW